MSRVDCCDISRYILHVRRCSRLGLGLGLASRRRQRCSSARTTRHGLLSIAIDALSLQLISDSVPMTVVATVDASCLIDELTRTASIDISGARRCSTLANATSTHKRQSIRTPTTRRRRRQDSMAGTDRRGWQIYTYIPHATYTPLANFSHTPFHTEPSKKPIIPAAYASRVSLRRMLRTLFPNSQKDNTSASKPDTR